MGSHAARVGVTASSGQTCCLPYAPRVTGSVCLDLISLLQLPGSVMGDRGGVVLGGLLKSSEALAALGQHPKVSPAQGPPQHGLGPLWCIGRHPQ